MKHKVIYQISIILFLLSVLNACTPNQEEVASIKLTVSADGPFFAGPNSLMANYTPDLNQLISNSSLKKEAIKKVTLKKVILSVPENEEYSMGDFSSASLQVVSDDSPMTSIAILNPINASSTPSIELVASEEAEITQLFKENQFTIVVDLDFKEDNYMGTISTLVEMEVNIEY